MPTTPVRVVVWSTGWIGSIAIRAIHRRPDLELIGVWVHTPEKVGKDAGELAGAGPIGIAATDDVDALLALDPRASCTRRAARAGCRRGPRLRAPPRRRRERRHRDLAVPGVPTRLRPGVARRPRGGGGTRGASLYASGIEPGFAADQLPLVLTTMSNTVTSIRSSELALYDHYPVAFMMMDVMGFGRPLDYEPLLATPGAQTGAWGPPIRLVATGLGVELDEIREEFDRVPTDRTLEVACGTIEAGTCGALRTQTIGVVDGHDAIVIEHVNRMAADLAPEWPIGERDGTYRIVIEGDPNIECTMAAGDPAASTAGAMVATAMRVVNAVPYVVDAPPGLLSSLDLPLTLPQHALVP